MPTSLPPSRTKRTPRLTETQFHAIARALADPRRFAILQQIAGADSILCSSLREQEIITPATVSHHIKELTDAGLTRVEREGRVARLFLVRPVFEAYLKRLAKL